LATGAITILPSFTTAISTGVLMLMMMEHLIYATIWYGSGTCKRCKHVLESKSTDTGHTAGSEGVSFDLNISLWFTAMGLTLMPRLDEMKETSSSRMVMTLVNERKLLHGGKVL
jgi:hypothetical protein